MFGYNEHPYEVDKTHEVNHPAGRAILELRRPLRGTPAQRYISLQAYNTQGVHTADILLLYGATGVTALGQPGADEHLDADWARLVADYNTELKSLNYIERISNHHVGYGRDGSVTMY